MIPLDYVEYGDTVAVLVIRNIHTRKVLQVRTQNNLEATYKAIPGGVCTMRVDRNLSIISANEEFYRMMGETQADYENGYLEHIYPKDAERVSAYFHIQAERKADLENYLPGARYQRRCALDAGKRNPLWKSRRLSGLHAASRTDMSHYSSRRSARLKRSRKNTRKYADNVIDTLSNLVEFRDLDSGEHIKRTKDLTRILIKYL